MEQGQLIAAGRSLCDAITQTSECMTIVFWSLLAHEIPLAVRTRGVMLGVDKSVFLVRRVILLWRMLSLLTLTGILLLLSSLILLCFFCMFLGILVLHALFLSFFLFLYFFLFVIPGATRTAVGALVLLNSALFMVDHIHFQYNGFLLGLLLLSMGLITNVRCQPRQLKLTYDAEVKGAQGCFRGLRCSRSMSPT